MCFSCAFRISKSRTPISKIHPVFTPETPTDFGIASFCDMKECNCAIFMCFLYLYAFYIYVRFMCSRKSEAIETRKYQAIKPIKGSFAH